MVRMYVCEKQPDAPAEALLRMVQEWDSCSRYDMLDGPRFPRKGLARYADHPSPCARRLAVYDPDAPPELIERLSHDESVWIRQHAADDDRLSPARIDELPREFGLARTAARNPALTGPAMHRLLDELGIPA